MDLRERRKVRTAFVDDHKDSTEAIMMKARVSHPLADVDTQFDFVPGNRSQAEIVADLERYDTCVIDYNLPGPIGIELAKKIRERRKNVPITLMSALPLEKLGDEGDIIRAKALQATTGPNPVITSVWEKKIDDCAGLARILRRDMFKPINIGFWGIGETTIGLISEARKSDDVQEIWAVSRHYPLPELYQTFEETPGDGKIRAQTNELEEMLDNVDILMLSGSTVPGRQGPTVSKGKREALYPYESKRFATHSHYIQQNSYQGLIATTANPVNLLLEKMRREGLPHDQLFSLYEPDSTRQLAALRRKLGAERYSLLSALIEKRKEQTNMEPRTMARLVVGIHGKSRVIVPEQWEEVLTSEDLEMIKAAEEEAERIGHRSYASAARTAKPAHVPYSTNASLTHVLARYKQFPQNVNVFYTTTSDERSVQGFVAVPARINYRDWRIAPDGTAIQHIGKDRIDECVRQFLEEQTDFDYTATEKFKEKRWWEKLFS